MDILVRSTMDCFVAHQARNSTSETTGKTAESEGNVPHINHAATADKVFLIHVTVGQLQYKQNLVYVVRVPCSVTNVSK